MMKKMLIAAAVAWSLSACAFTVDSVDLSYKPAGDAVIVGGAENVAVKVTVSDARAVNRDRISVKKDDFGIEMAAIIAKQDVPSFIGQAVESELSARGFRIAPGSVFVLVDLSKFYNDFKIGYFVGGAVGEVMMSAQVMNASGKSFYAKIYSGVHTLRDVMIASGRNAKRALDAALADAVAKMMQDQYFIQALIEAGRPASAGGLTGPAS